MSQYDIHNEEDMKKHCSESEAIADQYKDACKAFGDAKFLLDELYVKAIVAGKIKESIAMEKALAVIAQDSPEAKAEYDIFIKSEMLMKGLEKVLETRGRTITVHQSLMKNRAAQKI